MNNISVNYSTARQQLNGIPYRLCILFAIKIFGHETLSEKWHDGHVHVTLRSTFIQIPL